MSMPLPGTQARAPWAWLLAGVLCGTLVTTVCLAPARWLAQAVQHFSAGRLQLQSPQGTVWQGSAQWVVGAGQASGITDTLSLPGRIAWSWSLQWQGGPAIGLALHAPSCRQAPIDVRWLWNQGQPQLRIGAIAAHDSLRIPAPILNAVGAPWNSLQLDGTLAFSSSDLHIPLQAGPNLWQGQWQLDVLNLASSLSTLRPLGSYRVASDAHAPNQVVVSTLDGYLQIQGQGQWIARRLRFQGFAQAALGYEDALHNLLNIIGRRQGARSLLQIG